MAFIDGYVNAEMYKDILKAHLLPSIENHLSKSNDVTFQDDSAPCHRAKTVSYNFFSKAVFIINKITKKNS